jgi:hypothetical protein
MTEVQPSGEWSVLARDGRGGDGATSEPLGSGGALPDGASTTPHTDL